MKKKRKKKKDQKEIEKEKGLDIKDIIIILIGKLIIKKS